MVAAGVGGLAPPSATAAPGLLVDGHDPHDYAAALDRISDEVLRRRLGDGAVRHAAHFDWSNTATGVLEVYRAALLRPDRAASPLRVGGMSAGDPAAVLAAGLEAAGVEWSQPSTGLLRGHPARHPQAVHHLLMSVGAHALTINAFVARRPDENHVEVYRWLLERNARMYALAFTIDARRHLSGRPRPAHLDRRRRGRPAARQRPGVRRRRVQPDPGARLRLGHPPRVRLAGLRGESTANLAAFRGWLER